MLFFVSSVPSLPLSIYSTFVLEEKHGFNKTTPSLFVTDLLKGWAVGFVIGAPFLAAFLWVFKWAGDRFVPWLMAFLYSIRFFVIELLIYMRYIQARIPDVHGRHLSYRDPTTLQQAVTLSRRRATQKD